MKKISIILVLINIVCSLNHPLCGQTTPANSSRSLHIVFADSLEWLDMLAEMNELTLAYVQSSDRLYHLLQNISTSEQITCFAEEVNADELSRDSLDLPFIGSGNLATGPLVRYPLLRLFSETPHARLIGLEPASDSGRSARLRKIYDRILETWVTVQQHEYSADDPATRDIRESHQAALDTITKLTPMWREQRYSILGAEARLKRMFEKFNNQRNCPHTLALLEPPYTDEVVWRVYRAGKYNFKLRTSDAR